MMNKLITASQKFSPNLRKIIGNTAWQFADKAVRMGGSLIVGVWIARYLGPKQFGLLNYTYAFVSLFSAFATLGLDNIVVHDIVRDPERKNEVMGTAFTLKLISGIVVPVLTIAGVFLLNPSDTLTLGLVGITAAGMVFQAFDNIDFWFQSQVQSKYTIWARNGAFVLISMIKIALIQIQAPLIAFVWAGLAEICLSAVGLVIAYRFSGQLLRAWHVSIPYAKTLLKQSWPLILASFSIAIYMKIDMIMLEKISGDKAVGIYAVATRFSEIWYFIPTSIVSSVFPAIVEAKKISDDLYYQRLQRLFNLMTKLALAIAIPMTFLSGHLVVALYGETYRAAGSILAVHIWAAIFVFLGVAQGPWNITEGLLKLNFQRTLIGAIINVLLNIIFIPLYAGFGAAISTVVSYAIAAFFSNLVDKRTKKIFILQMRSMFILYN